MQSIEQFNAELARGFREAFAPGNITPGHTRVHTESMKIMGTRIQGIKGAGGRKLRFSFPEFEAAVDLHNADERCFLFKEEIATIGHAAFCRKYLEQSPYSEEARERIVSAAVNHRKYKDQPDDPALDQAIRIADKVVRFAPTGIVGCGASHSELEHYNMADPFWHGRKGKEKDYDSHYKLFYYPLEWYGMLPSDEARALIKPRWLSLEIEFMRCFAEEISENSGYPNAVEEDLRIVFGIHYDRVMGIVREWKEQH